MHLTTLYDIKIFKKIYRKAESSHNVASITIITSLAPQNLSFVD